MNQRKQAYKSKPMEPARRVRLLCPGDWLVNGDGIELGFVWEVNGDVVEVRSYHDADNPKSIFLTRIEASAYRIKPNPAHGIDRPFVRVRA